MTRLKAFKKMRKAGIKELQNFLFPVFLYSSFILLDASGIGLAALPT
jgi:hypothetical protein